ncbi:MAG: hypothetical protein Kow001_18990 [Acidobacteriota bacterium]
MTGKSLVGAAVCLIVFAEPLALGTPELGGYFKNFNAVYRFPGNETGAEGEIFGLASGRFRLNLNWRATTWLSAGVAYDLAPRLESKALLLGFLPSLEAARRGYRLTDFRPRLDSGGDDGNFALYHNLDRAYLEVRLPVGDLTFGRQAIAFGSGRFVNPTDLLAPFAYGELDVEDRVGVDAVRFRLPLGRLGELDSGYVFGRDGRWSSSAAFIRARGNWKRMDGAAILLAFQEHMLLGLDLAGPVGGAGWWLEAAQVLVGAAAGRREPGQDYFRAVTGLDYTLGDGTYLFVEYHFSEAGAAQPARYTQQFSRASFQDGLVYFLARHYLGSGLSRQVTPLVTVDARLLVNLNDGSLFLAPALDYNVAENLYLGGGVYIGLGRRPQQAQLFRSEFGAWPDFGYISVRWYY